MLFDCSDDAAFDEGLAAAVSALENDELVVVSTDTVYGLAADASSQVAVQRLLDAKGRGRDMPPPVLISGPHLLDTIASDVPDWLRRATERFWPGPFTVICRQQASLSWDLGETHNTVALRMPDDRVALALLKQIGPLAVSSANTTGDPAATTAAEAQAMLGDKVSVYLDGGPATSGQPSTILDATGSTPRVLRPGSIGVDALHEFNNTIVDGSGVDGTGEGAGA